MKNHLAAAAVSFFGIAAMIALFDLLAARFDPAVFAQTVGRPGHAAFAVVLGLILAAGAFVRPVRRLHAA